MKEPYIGRALSRIGRVSRTEMVDLTECRAHLNQLQCLGMTSSMISRAAGTSTTTVRNVINGQPTAVPQVASALLAVTPRPHKQQALVLSYSTIRRLQGLAVQGWSFAKVGAEAGMDYRQLHHVTEGTRCAWSVYLRVADVYERLSHLDGGNARTKAWADREGFVHPMLWDDIEDYWAEPAAPECDSRGSFVADYEHFRGFGWSDADIAVKLGMEPASLQVRLRRMGVAA